MDELTNQQKAVRDAEDKVIALLGETDIRKQCELHGLRCEDGIIEIEFLSDTVVVNTETFSCALACTETPVNPIARVLILRYLHSSVPVKSTGTFITFRELPGGQFYWGPFQNRTTLPLAKRIGNDTDLLRSRLGRLEWEPIELGDLGASITVTGDIRLALVHRRGDDEFPPSMEILFDPAIKRLYSTEDAVMLASLLCWKLMG